MNNNTRAKCAELIKTFESGDKFFYKSENGNYLDIEFTGKVSEKSSCVAEFRVLTENNAGFNVGEIFWLDISKGSFEPLANASRVNGNAANRRRKSRKTRKATRRNRK